MRAPPGIPTLAHLYLATLALAGLLATASGQTPEAVALPLTNAAQVRQLTAVQASRSVPVRLRGVVVTEAAPSADRAAVIWDGTAGVYLLGPPNLFSNVQRGDLIEVIGITDPGEFAPIVNVRTLQTLGTAPPPPPRQATLEELLSGGLDAQWVEVSGVVRSLDLEMPPEDFGQWHMDLAVGGGRVSVVSNGAWPSQVVPDARVRLQAACFYQFTRKRQVLRPMLLVPAGVPVEVEKPASADAYAAPVRLVGSLMGFSPGSALGHRVHVCGVVTHHEPGTTVWIRDASGALRIQTLQPEHLEPGDVIDVLGFPKYGSYPPALEDAIFQRRSRGRPPAPIQLGTPAAAFDHQADLIALVAKLTETQPLHDGWALTFEQDGTVFKALLRSGSGLSATSQWRPGSLVRVAGICSVFADDASPVLSGVWHPQSFQLLLRSRDDLTTLKPAPWLTARHFIFLLLILTGASLLVTAGVMWRTRRRLRDQTQHRAMAEAEFAAILSERNRVAREIHDTLAQGLVATSVQLRLARKNADGAPESVTRHLEAAQQLVGSSLEEARNSIWNMRSQVLETGDLASALRGILQQMADGTEVATQFEVLGKVRRLAPVVENNLLRIGQEAITNATKHAQARRIAVELDFGEKQFRLTVSDDGRGFDAAKPVSKEGGFGLVGMRERAAHLKGELNVRSVPGQGTRLSLKVPLSGE